MTCIAYSGKQQINIHAYYLSTIHYAWRVNGSLWHIRNSSNNFSARTHTHTHTSPPPTSTPDPLPTSPAPPSPYPPRPPTPPLTPTPAHSPYPTPNWTNVWVNNRNTGDLRHHRAHYDVTLMPNENAEREDCLPYSAFIVYTIISVFLFSVLCFTSRDPFTNMDQLQSRHG